ncbi:MAG: penicillin-insensitive murein endopeptidase [Hyphomicrobiales bacterium]|jgi:penicillin-insensitive murein endopeptidase|nr:penicillin-insensitive murein endopeptidase [Hyphomicrobiales bacterium]MCC7480395.1 penicillin-insensitive murein endopeptidase [Hyphomicrobiales bacterium]
MQISMFFAAFLAAILFISAPLAQAQTAEDQAALAALTAADLKHTPAKKLFGAKKLPVNLQARAIGSYAKGCLSGGKALSVTGPAWQAMRTSRNRNWAHPALVKLVEKLAKESKQSDGWNGLLVGDMSQPRGGPMLTGHASHQIGLDADVWFTPMPDRVLTSAERETYVPVEMVKDRSTLNRDNWSESRARLIRRAASYPEVARIFVHPPIKAELCKWAKGDRSWLAKVRPYYNHTYHFHVRMKCPPGFAGCKNQAPAAPKDGTGCGEEMAYWMGDIPWKPKKRDPNAKPVKPAPALTLAGLPAECRAVVTAP